jgi:hypothetical protein
MIVRGAKVVLQITQPKRLLAKILTVSKMFTALVKTLTVSMLK